MKTFDEALFYLNRNQPEKSQTVDVIASSLILYVSISSHRGTQLMTEPKEHLKDWLRDAYAMEQQAEKMLKGQASRLEHYPELRARIEQHIQETVGQQNILEDCLKRLGTSPSTLKDAMGKMMAMGQAMGGMMASDEVVKGSIAGYVFEQTEIANYKALIVAAESVGEAHIAQSLQKILEQEEEMAAWLDAQLPSVVQAFLSRDAVDGVPANR